jgi:hypothetical protein
MKNKTMFGALATVNANVSPFNLGWSPLLNLPDNDMIDEDLNDTLLHINMSVKPENPKSRLCVLVAFTCLDLCTFMSVNKYLLKHDRDIWFRSKILSFKLVFINKFESKLLSLLSGTICTWLFPQYNRLTPLVYHCANSETPIGIIIFFKCLFLTILICFHMFVHLCWFTIYIFQFHAIIFCECF